MPDLKNIKWDKLAKNIKRFFIDGADFLKYKISKFSKKSKNSTDKKTVDKKSSPTAFSDILKIIINLFSDMLSGLKAIAGGKTKIFSSKYVTISAMTVLSAIAGYSFSFMTPKEQEVKSAYVAITTAQSEETVPETEEIIESVEIPKVLPDLTADVFEGNRLEIMHTDFIPSEEISSKIENLAKGYNKKFSVYMVDLDDYAAFGYNADLYLPTASTIKLPFAYYCCNEMEKGNHNLDERLVYKKKYYTAGTGVMQNHSIGNDYSIRALMYYMLHFSDNVAYLMLLDCFGYEGYNEMMEGYGFETYLSEYIQWGKLSAHSLGYIWTQVFENREECFENEVFYYDLVHAESNFLERPLIDEGYSYNVAHKSGWASPGYHDAGIVLSEHPFVLVVMTESEGQQRDKNFFNSMVSAMNELHDEYLVYADKQPSQKGVSTPEKFMPVYIEEDENFS